MTLQLPLGPPEPGRAEARTDLVEGRYLDARLWAALGSALGESNPVNIFGLQGYGRSTLLAACGAWLDTYLVTVPCIILNGTDLLGSDLRSRVDSYAQACASAKVIPSARARKHLGAVLIDDIEQADSSVLIDLNEYVSSLSALNILFVCTSVARQQLPSATHIEAPGASRSVSQLLAESIPSAVIADLDSFIDGCPELINCIESGADPACLLPDPWSPDECGPNPALQKLPSRTRALLGLNPTMGLVAGLLSRATSFIGLVQVVGFIENEAKDADGEEPESFRYFDTALKALKLTEDSMLTTMRESVSSRMVELAILRGTGLLNSGDSLIMRAHPLIFSSAVAELSEEERSAGSPRLDWLARIYAAHLFKQAIIGQQSPQRLDLHISCLLYCVRRGLTVTSSRLIGMLPLDVARRSTTPSLGHQLRANILKHTGHRPGPDQEERYLWMNSFILTPPEDGGSEAIEAEVALIDEELSAGERFSPDLLGHILIVRAAVAANTGKHAESVVLYEAAVRACEDKLVKARALHGLAMLFLDEGKPAIAQKRLEELSELGIEGLTGRLTIGMGYEPGFLSSIASADMNHRWAALSQLDSIRTTHAIGSRDHASEAGRNFHERGLSALELGHLDEAQRLLDEAVRLKGRVEDDRLLSTSYLAQARLSLRKGDRPMAVQWLLAVSNLDDARIENRLSAMIQLLALIGDEVSGTVETAQLRTIRILDDAITKGKHFDICLLLDWATSLDNARADELLSLALRPVLERRIGSDLDYAIANVISGRAAGRTVNTVPQLPPDALGILKSAVDHDPSIRNRNAYAFALVVSCLSYLTSSDPDSREAGAALYYSRMALRSAVFFCDLGSENDDFVFFATAANMAVSIAEDWESGDWSQLLASLQRVPVDNDIWESDLLTEVIYKFIRASVLYADGLSDGIVQYIALLVETGKHQPRLCNSFFLGVQEIIRESGPGWLPNVSSRAALLQLVGNRGLTEDTWYHTTHTLAMLCYQFATLNMVDDLQELANAALAALRARGSWPLGGPISRCLMYDGIVAFSADASRALERVRDLRELEEAGCPEALVSEFFLYQTSLPRLVADSGSQLALDLVIDYIARVRSANLLTVKLGGSLVDLVAELAKATSPEGREQALGPVIQALFEVVRVATGDDDRSEMTDRAAVAVLAAGLRAAASSSAPEPIEKCNQLFSQWLRHSPMANTLHECCQFLNLIFEARHEADAAIQRAVDQIIVRDPSSLGAPNDVRPVNRALMCGILAGCCLTIIHECDAAALNRLRGRLAYLARGVYKSPDAGDPTRKLSAALLFELWATTSDWQTSNIFLQNYPELFTQDAKSASASSGENPSSPRIAVHQAILTLASDPTGIENAYRCIADRRELEPLTVAALKARNPDRLHACSILEILIHGQAFLGMMHQVLASLLAKPKSQLSPSLASHLAALAAKATAAERNQAAAHLGMLSTSAFSDAPGFRQLRHALSASS